MLTDGFLIDLLHFRHDDMAGLIGLHTQSFRNKFKDQTNHLKQSMLQYAWRLHDLAEHKASVQLDPGVVCGVFIRL